MLETNKERKTGGGPDRRDRGLGGFVRRHGLVSFYALAYGLSWLAWLPYLLSQSGVGVLQFSFPQLLGTTQFAGVLPGAYLGPLGAAFIVTAIAEGRQGLRRWTGRLFRWGVNWKWYALALLGVPALLVLGTLAVSPGSAAGLGFPPLGLLLAYLPFLVLQMATTGLAEEPGWRDFALVRHQRLHGPLLGTLILGVLWAGWHLPLFLTEWGRGMGGANAQAILLFVAFCLVFSVFITWLFNRTNESLPVVMLAHVSVNNFASVMWFAIFTNLNPYGQAANWASVVGFAWSRPPRPSTSSPRSGRPCSTPGGSKSWWGCPLDARGGRGGGTDGVLSARELEVLLLAARGLSNEQISSALFIAEATVKRHMANVYERMGVQSRGEAAREALMRDWITIGKIRAPAPGKDGKGGPS